MYNVAFFENKGYRIIARYKRDKKVYNSAYTFIVFSQDELHNTQKPTRYFPDRRASGSIQSPVF